MFVIIIIGLYSSRLVLSALGSIDYGIYSVVGGIVLLMGFFNTVMVTSSHRFIALEIGQGDDNSINRVFSVSLVIHFIIALLTLFLAETCGLYYIYNYLNIPVDRISDAVFVFQFSLLVTLVSIISIPYQAYLTANENFSFIAIVNVFTSLMTLVIALILSFEYTEKLRIYVFLLFIVNLVNSFLYILYCHKKYKKLSVILVLENRLYKEMFRFSGWVMLGAGSSVGRNQGSALLINSFFGPSMNTSFGIANQINSQIEQFSQNVNRAVIPQITKSYGEGEFDRMVSLVCSSSKYTFFMMYVIAFPLLLEMDYVLKLWLGNVPAFTSIFCRLLLINLLIESMSAGIPTAVQASGKVKYFQITSSVLSLSSLPISYLLFKNNYGSYVIIGVYILSSLLILITTQILLKKILSFNTNYFFKKVYLRCVCVVISTLPLVLFAYVETSNIYLFSIKYLFLVFSVFCIIYIIGVNQKEKMYIKKYVYTKLNTFFNK